MKRVTFSSGGFVSSAPRARVATPLEGSIDAADGSEAVGGGGGGGGHGSTRFDMSKSSSAMDSIKPLRASLSRQSAGMPLVP